MNIVAAGDSFTYGEELPDLTQAYPCVLGKMLPGDNTIINLAEPAGSNDKAVRKLTEYFLDNSADLVLIGWTSPGRLEFADENGIFDIWPGYSGNLFINDGMEFRNILNKYFSTYHDKKFLYTRYLQNIILMQSFLKSKKINYIMMDVMLKDVYKIQKNLRAFETYQLEIDNKFFIEYNIGSMMEWVGNSPKGPRGHFLEDGHKLVANRIYEHIRNLSWLS